MNKPSLFVRIRALLHAVARSIWHARAAGLGPAQILRKAINCIRLGPRGFARHVIAYDQLAQVDTRKTQRIPTTAPEVTATGTGLSAYERWLQQHEPAVATITEGPLISVVMPTCNTPESFLHEVIASVLARTYRNWELCICDDASDASHVYRILADVARRDPRIRIIQRQQRGGIANATNDALKLATGDYVAPLDHDDLLHPEALASVAAVLVQTGADIAYTDHDCVDEDGNRRLPYFKPDWSLDLFLSQMYLGHLVVFRRDMVDRLGGLRPEMDGSQDYDLVLRCYADGAQIAHVPRVLYHWRQHSGSTSANADSKPYAHEAGRKAIQSYLDGSYPGAQAKDGAYTFCYDVRYNLTTDQPLVSIVIPTRDRVDLLDVCVRTLREQTDYKHYEILVVDNGSIEPLTMQWFERMSGDASVRVLPADIPFNWSALNNLAAREARGKVLVFLNNDTEIIDGQWLERLADIALRPDVGVCGPLLLYGDMTIQHAGVVVGMGGWADHVFKGLPASHAQDCFASPVMRRNVLAVTGACMAIEKTKFDALGGFDESFIVCGSDVEICLRAFHSGLLNVYVPEAKLVHHESKTRDPGNIPETDFVRSEQAYRPYRTAGDPYFNHNLDPMSCVPRPRNMP